LEAGGDFSVYKVAGEVPPGLPVFPTGDEEIVSIQKKAENVKACNSCGFITTSPDANTCENCLAEEFSSAIY
jgi:hypothetical protein